VWEWSIILCCVYTYYMCPDTHTTRCVSSYYYICVLERSVVGGVVDILTYYMCPYSHTRTTRHVSSYHYICVLQGSVVGGVTVTEQGLGLQIAELQQQVSSVLCVSSYYHMCPHATICVLMLLYVSSYYHICVLMLLYTCPHTPTYHTSASYYRVCVLILIYIILAALEQEV
jgi:hypothetical protein